MPDKTFSCVWYRSSKKVGFELPAYQDSGTLVVGANRIEFVGTNRLVIEKIVGLSYGKQGIDFVNNWVRIDYEDRGEAKAAFFADGSWLGWGGIFGGTRRIFDAIDHGSDGERHSQGS
jgi:hypothetical protein